MLAGATLFQVDPGIEQCRDMIYNKSGTQLVSGRTKEFAHHTMAIIHHIGGQHLRVGAGQ
jgi:hypothetical protein